MKKEHLNPSIRNKIINFLKDKDIGASSSETAKVIRHNRVTVTKYLEIMKAEGLLDYNVMAQAKFWRFVGKKRVPKVLVVDDEPHIVNLIKLSLEKEYDVIEAFTGMEALERISEKPDAVVLDLMMPGINGYDVCQRMKNNPHTRHIPIIILSAKADLKDKIRGIEIGGDDYITKPFDPLELNARIRSLLKENSLLTSLPGEEELESEIKDRNRKREKFVGLKVSLKSFDNFNNNSGFKKGQEVLKMLSSLIEDHLDSKSFIAHTKNDEFIILSEKDVTSSLKSAFNKVSPYLFNNSKDKMQLIVKPISIKADAWRAK